MNDKSITKIHNIVTNALECSGVELSTAMFTNPKKSHDGYYVDISIEDFGVEDLACLVGFLAELIGMKNIWFDTYPKSGRAHLELNFPDEFLAQ